MSEVVKLCRPIRKMKKIVGRTDVLQKGQTSEGFCRRYERKTTDNLSISASVAVSAAAAAAAAAVNKGAEEKARKGECRLKDRPLFLFSSSRQEINSSAKTFQTDESKILSQSGAETR